MAALHLEHMGHGVGGPDILAVDLHRPLADRLGRFIVAGFFQGKGMHPQHIAEIGPVLAPRG